MIATFHQPHFLPWLGYYNKLANSQLFIVQDNVQYRKDYFQNRTLIRGFNNNTFWLRMPVYHSLNSSIKDIYVCKKNWKRKILLTIYHKYHNAPFFLKYYNDIEEIIQNCTDSLLSINLSLLIYTIDLLDIKLDLFFCSEFEKQLSSTEDIIYICKRLGISDVIFGEGGGLVYHGVNLFKTNKIHIQKQDFKVSFSDFSVNYFKECYNLSIIDYLFNLDIDIVKGLVKCTWKI